MNKLIETVVCECCGNITSLESAKMDDEEANWYCLTCIKAMNEHE